MQIVVAHSREDDINTLYFHTKVNFNKRRKHTSAIQDSLGIFGMIQELKLKTHYFNISPRIQYLPSILLFLSEFQSCSSETENAHASSVSLSEQKIKDVVFK